MVTVYLAAHKAGTTHSRHMMAANICARVVFVCS
jgi:hypothetical protein